MKQFFILLSVLPKMIFVKTQNQCTINVDFESTRNDVHMHIRILMNDTPLVNDFIVMKDVDAYIENFIEVNMVDGLLGLYNTKKEKK